MENVKFRVLAVDDDEGALEIIKMYLEDIAQVATVSSGKEALQYVQDYPVDIILLDITMPVMDGFKTLEKFRNLKESINVPVVFVTGRSDRITVMNSGLMGVDGYLVKPVDKLALRQKVLEICQKRNKESSKKTILAIDDDMAYLKLINSYLCDSYNVVMINSAKLALNYLGKHIPDLILLDYKMPLYNGGNVLSMIQKNSDVRDVPVIMVSGVIDKQVLKECYPYKPAACLIKPVSREMLIENVEKALGQEMLSGE